MSTKLNKAIPFLRANQTAEQLKIQDWPYPKIKDTQLIIEVKAFGVNFADVIARKGQYQAAPPFPFVPGYEVSGIIIEKGSQVEKFQIGDRVAALTPFGGYSKYVATESEGAVKFPDDWSFSQAASIGVSFVTAYYALHMTGPVRPGDRVLIHACAGALGLALVQLCKLAGYEIYGTCGSDAKAKFLSEKGVQHTINYRSTDFETEIKRLTNNEGVDIVFDSVGGSYFKKDLNILRTGGRVVALGASSMTDRGITKIFSLIPQIVSMISISSIDLMLGSKSFCGVNLKEISDHKPKILESCWTSVIELFVTGKLKIDKITEFNWSEIGKALDEMESRKTTGKIVMLISEDNKEERKEEKKEESKELKEEEK